MNLTDEVESDDRNPATCLRLAISCSQDLVLMSSGVADESQRDAYRKRVKSVVSYADPAAWRIVTAVGAALCPHLRRINESLCRVGLIVSSVTGPVTTMDVVGKATAEGVVSPLRFAAANPGSLAGLTATVFGFHGPALNLTCSPQVAAPICSVLAAAWLRRKVVDWMIVVVDAPARTSRPEPEIAADMLDTVAVLLGRPSDSSQTP